jgi:hypothetical protein
MEYEFLIEGQGKKSMSWTEKVKKVITDPAGFYGEMPKSGGFMEPYIFMAGMALITAVIQIVLSTVVGIPFPLFAVVAYIIIMPVAMLIFGFISAAIVFIIWKILGSQETFETSYRCLAYACAILPVGAVLEFIPYAGEVIGLVWITYLMVVASTEVHKVKARPAWMVFGAICVVFSLISIVNDYLGRKMVSEIGIEEMKEMSPEEFGEAMDEAMEKIIEDTLEGSDK